MYIIYMETKAEKQALRILTQRRKCIEKYRASLEKKSKTVKKVRKAKEPKVPKEPKKQKEDKEPKKQRQPKKPRKSVKTPPAKEIESLNELV